MTMRQTPTILLLVAMLATTAFGAGELAPTDFANDAAARKAWEPMTGTPPAVARTIDGRRGVGYVGAVGELKERASYDCPVSAPVGSATRIRLWVYCDRPDAFRGGTLYLRSGGGWYAASLPIGQGWRRVTFDLGDFQTEGAAGPIERANLVRVSFWRAQIPPASAATALVADIRAEASDVVLVSPSAAGANTPAGRSARQYAKRVRDLLARLDLDPPSLDEAHLTPASLAGAKVAIFPLPGQLPAGSREAVSQFVARGGKLLVCYTAPAPLADLLGLGKTTWTAAPSDAALAEITFASAAGGLPKRIVQRSWCCMEVQPSPGANVLGRWSNGAPAVVSGPGGWFVGHVLTAGDDAAKARFLAAALADLAPTMRTEIAAGALRVARAAAPGVEARLTANGARLSPARTTAARDRLTDARKLAARRVDFAGALDAAESIRRLVDEAGCLAVPAWGTKYRAVWCHAATGLPDRPWSVAAGVLHDSGVRMLVVNVCSGGLAHYPSKVLATDPRSTADGDPVAACLAAMKPLGMQVHAWRVCWNLQAGPKAFVTRMKAAGRTQVSRSGVVGDWLAPHLEENFALERDAMRELLTRYAFDGVHLDYIRYPDSAHDYSPSVRRAFETASGRRVTNWPADVLGGGPTAGAFRTWRAEQITRLVRAVRDDARRLRPGAAVSAAVFRDWGRTPETIGQNVGAWLADGLLDFVCPMDYTADDAAFATAVADQRKRTPAGVPLLAGIGVTLSARDLSAAHVAEQIDLARRAGADGFILFNFTPTLADETLPRLRLGPLAEED